ncbi:MAG: hypothetical protein LBR51_05220 [Bacteroidales bacterium]|jgi:hypothetical protein|nr:hypothetical protein [Bacteroidales bacterium]
MKRIVFIGILLGVVLATSFVACIDNTSILTEQEKNATFLTEATLGWKLKIATATPTDSTLSEPVDLLPQMAQWDIDDIVIYHDADKTVHVDPGSELPANENEGFMKTQSMGAWSFTDEAATQFSTQVPFLYSAGMSTRVNSTLTTLNAKTLKFNFVQSLNHAFGLPSGNYTIALTYVAL